MSNPFRKNPLSSNVSDSNNVSLPDIGGVGTPGLSINTKAVPGPSDRHVSFASPPVARTIPAASYPSSPESTRISPAFYFSRPTLPTPTDYSTALQNDPFGAGDLVEEGDDSIKEALSNAQSNAAASDQVNSVSKENAVKDTLSRFSSAPRRNSSNVDKPNDKPQDAATSRNTMDVDAFKRLLLTGDSSSSIDTSSLSQHSAFDSTGLASEETPRTSQEMDLEVAARVAIKSEKKLAPPRPAPRRNKSNRSTVSPVDPETAGANFGGSYKGQIDLVRSTSAEPARKPPPPPLSRRQSSKTTVPESDASQAQVQSSEEEVTSSLLNNRMAPVTSSRRRGSAEARKSSQELAPTQEEPEDSEIISTASGKSSSLRPPPPPSRNSSSSKRASLAAMQQPPLPPPPRRNRGSSRSSMEAQRPSMSAIMETNVHGSSARSSAEWSRLTDDARRSSASSCANDILANLAALQKDVDAARMRGT